MSGKYFGPFDRALLNASIETLPSTGGVKDPDYFNRPDGCVALEVSRQPPRCAGGQPQGRGVVAAVVAAAGRVCGPVGWRGWPHAAAVWTCKTGQEVGPTRWRWRQRDPLC